jgi:tetraacyldisaccharide 4'-kinase
LPQGDLRGKKVCAFCGIARPESFKKLLVEAEAQLLSFIPFPDHYAYDRYELEGLKKQFRALGADYWITTEKDAMRLTAHPEFLKMLWVLRMEMEMEIETSRQSFENFIIEGLAAVAYHG